MRFLFLALTTFVATPLRAEPPKVMTDIAPIHSIVASVMQDIAFPGLLFEADVSPHHAALRPSQARALSQAEVVIWMGPGLSPQLEGVIAGLAPSAQAIVLASIEDTVSLPTREVAVFEHEDHEEHEEHEDHAEADAKEDHEDHEGHEDHAHAAGSPDPHGWLDPKNAGLWAQHIAAVLAEMDPENAAKYSQNADQFSTQMDASMRVIAQQMDDLPNPRFVVLHDATQYFENRFGLAPLAAIAASDAATPGPARVKQVRDLILQQQVSCIFSEPQPGDKLIGTVAQGLPLRRGVLDPLGLGIELGPDFYGVLITQMADSFAACLSDDG